jgi:hypothetical protein
MPNSKRPRHRSEVFRNRFERPNTEAAPVRHLQRAREERIGAVIQIALLVAFEVALVLLAQSVVHLFASHGGDINPAVRVLCLAGIAGVALVTARRIVMKIKDLQEIVRDIRELESQVRSLRSQLRHRN